MNFFRHRCQTHHLSRTTVPASLETKYSPPKEPRDSSSLEDAEEPYEACSDEEDDDDEHVCIEFPEVGEVWKPVVNALAGFHHEQAVQRIEAWADKNGYILTCRGDKC